MPVKKFSRPIIESQANVLPKDGMSTSMEQYVEAIAHLLTEDKVCSVSQIAEVAQVSRPAASRAVRELSDRNLVVHKAYGYVDLTDEGRALAGKLAARHEALFRFFRETLGMDADEADGEACRLEHHLRDDMVERLRALNAFLVDTDTVREAWHRRRD